MDGNNGTGRVCIITRARYPDDLRVVREATAMRVDGARVTVLCRGGGQDSERDIIDGVDVVRVRSTGSFAFFLRARLLLLGFLLSRRFDVVQVDTPPDGLVFAALPQRIFGARLIMRQREPGPEGAASRARTAASGIAKQWAEFVERAAAAFSSHVLTSHREMREVCGRRGISVNRVSTVVHFSPPAGFDRDRFHHLDADVAEARRSARRAGDYRILYYGDVAPGRGVDVVVESLPQLLDDIPGAGLHVLGRGDVAAFLDRAEALGVGKRVRMVEPADNDTVAAEILAAGIAVVPARWTPRNDITIPPQVLTLVELGCPVVASRLNAFTSYFDRDTFLYFTPGNPDDLAGRIHFAFAHPEEMRERADAARAVLEAFAWNRERLKYLRAMGRAQRDGRAKT